MPLGAFLVLLQISVYFRSIILKKGRNLHNQDNYLTLKKIIRQLIKT